MSRKIKPPFRTQNRISKVKKVDETPADAQPPAQPQPFVQLNLGAAETVIVFNALQNFFQAKSIVEKDNGQTLRVTTDLIIALQPAALLAAKQFSENRPPASPPAPA
jgi:hypothetical protein